MSALTRANEPFHFCTRMHLLGLTGFKAANLCDLLALIKEVPGSSIYHHTHRFLQQHQFFSPEPPNDFAYWIREVLGEEALAERLASIDIMEFSSIRDVRDAIAKTIEAYLQSEPSAEKKFARRGEEFVFIKSMSFVAWTDHYASDLREFADILKKITIDSIYFHIFESRLRLGKTTNDFSNWFEHALGEKALAQKIAGFDPYTLALEDLRANLVRLVEERIAHDSQT